MAVFGRRTPHQPIILTQRFLGAPPPVPIGKIVRVSRQSVEGAVFRYHPNLRTLTQLRLNTYPAVTPQAGKIVRVSRQSVEGATARYHGPVKILTNVVVGQAAGPPPISRIQRTLRQSIETASKRFHGPANVVVERLLIQTPNTLALTAPVSCQVFQQFSGAGTILVSGTYTGGPSAIEASFNGGPYTTIVASPSGGTFTAVPMAGQLAGQGTLTVRFVNDHSAVATVTLVGVGDVFICMGQSNFSGQFLNVQRTGGFQGVDDWGNQQITPCLFSNLYLWCPLSDPTDTSYRFRTYPYAPAVNFGDFSGITNVPTAAVMIQGFNPDFGGGPQIGDLVSAEGKPNYGGSGPGGSILPGLSGYWQGIYKWPIAFHTNQKSGRRIVQMLPNVGPPTNQPDGSPHDDRTTLYGSAHHRLAIQGTVANPALCRAFIYWQGYSDATAGTTHDTYLASLQTLADAIWADWGVPTIVFVETGPDLHDQGLLANFQAIQQAQRDSWGTHHILRGADFSDLNPQTNDGTGHLLTDGMAGVAASRAMKAIDLALNGAASGGGFAGGIKSGGAM